MIIIANIIFCLPSNSQVLINELGIAPTTGDAAQGGEFIELFNKGGCTGTVDIGCWVIMFSSTSKSDNPTGFTITIPPGTNLAPCSYYLIGGSGLTPGISWTTLGVGGNFFMNNYGANGRPPDLEINNSSNSGLQSLRPGNLVNDQGQVTLYNSTGGIVTSVSYKSGTITGNNAASYVGSFSKAPTGCIALTSLINPGPSPNNVNGTFSGLGNQGIYLTNSGNYAIETSLTPGKSNSLNGGTQICCNPTIKLNGALPICFSNFNQTASLSYLETTNSPTTYSITWNTSPNNSFATITNANLPNGLIC